MNLLLRTRRIGWLGLIACILTLPILASDKVSAPPSTSDLNGLTLGYTEHRTNLPGGRHANVSTGRACVIGLDGSERRELAADLDALPDTWTQFAGWSPDGQLAIVIQAHNSPENAAWEEEHKTFRHSEGWLIDTLLLDMQSEKRTNVTAVDRVSNYNAGLFFWPGDPKKLGFTPLINGISTPFSMDLDGRNKQDLSTGQSGFTYGFQASPDGKRICYHKNYQVVLADADGSNAITIDTGNPFNFAPRWSPDGRWVLFVSGEHYNCHPHIVGLDGKGLKKIADRGGYPGVMQFLDVPDYHNGSSDVPTWSQDSGSIFFTAKTGESVELMRADVSGKVTQLTKSAPGVVHYHPNPSPDGRWLVFGSTRQEGRRQLFVISTAGGEPRQITRVDTGWAAMHAHWRPRTTP